MGIAERHVLGGKTLTDDERIGLCELPPEFSRFGYKNNIRTLGPNLFNTQGIEQALQHLVALSQADQDRFMNPRKDTAAELSPATAGAQYQERLDDEVAVYFRNLHFGIPRVWPKPYRSPFDTYGVDHESSNKEPWHMLMNERFIPRLKDIPTNIFYDNGDEKFHQERERFKNPRHGQIFVHLYGGSLKAFSCFVNGDISVNAWTYRDEQAFWDYGHMNFNAWHGKLGDFLKTARTLETAIGQVMPPELVTARGRGEETCIQPEFEGAYVGGEIKLVHPQLGMIVMRGGPRQYKARHPTEIFKTIDAIDPATLIISPKAYDLLRQEVRSAYGLNRTA